MSAPELVTAFENGDRLAVRRLGWEPVHRALHTWWPKPNPPADAGLMRSYAEALGDEDPAAVLDALRALSGRWRPGAGEVLGHINGKRDDGASVDAGRGGSPALSPAALQAVAEALARGEEPCSCGMWLPTWLRARDWVLRCPRCDGLEHGQLYACEDAGLIREAA
jgi:hypothetical protein